MQGHLRPAPAVCRLFHFRAQHVQLRFVEIGGAALQAVQQAPGVVPVLRRQGGVEFAQAPLQVGNEGDADAPLQFTAADGPGGCRDGGRRRDAEQGIEFGLPPRAWRAARSTACAAT